MLFLYLNQGENLWKYYCDIATIQEWSSVLEHVFDTDFVMLLLQIQFSSGLSLEVIHQVRTQNFPKN